ncbi:MAG: hypothetical protein K0R03_2431 [Moraxellaceae bacterium]|jgi:hypothetical protein|nr:hypothetical protein [Moraxellaceae bacterium]
MLRLILRLQALYYFLTGLWPLLHLASFEAMAGPIADDWLAHAVGLLGLVIATALWLGTRHRQVPPDKAIVALGALSALAIAAIELFYGLSGRLSGLYLADAAFEIALVIAMGLALTIGWSRQRPGF